MEICNLLSITTRKNQNYEDAAVKSSEVIEEPAIYGSGNKNNTDSMTINGRVLDLMGSLTDEQIEKVMKVGYNQAVEDFIDIITTNNEISDEELINLYFNKGNIDESKINNKTRLRIVRKDTVKNRQKASGVASGAKSSLNKVKTAFNTVKNNAGSARTQLSGGNTETAIKTANSVKTDVKEIKENTNKALNSAQQVAKFDTEKKVLNFDTVFFEASGETKKYAVTVIMDAYNVHAAVNASEAEADSVIAEAELQRIITFLSEAAELRGSAQTLYDEAEPLDDENPEKATKLADAKTKAENASKKAQEAVKAMESARTSVGNIERELIAAIEAADLALTVADLILESTEFDLTDTEITAINAAKSEADEVKTTAAAAKESLKAATGLSAQIEEQAGHVESEADATKVLEDKVAALTSQVSGANALSDLKSSRGIIEGYQATAEENLETVNQKVVLAKNEETSLDDTKQAVQDAHDAAGAARTAADNAKTELDKAKKAYDEVIASGISLLITAAEEDYQAANDAYDAAERAAKAAEDKVKEADQALKDKSPADEEDENIYTLKRRAADGDDVPNSRIIAVEGTETVTVKLTNTFDGKEYSYKISRLTESTDELYIEHMDNGRFLIIGNDFKIEAEENQNDDIILIGNNNELYTNSGDDIVRVGSVIDSEIEGEQKCHDNTINTGAGNDIVQIHDLSCKLDLGDDVDRLLVINDTINNYSSVITGAKGIENHLIYSNTQAIGDPDNVLEAGFQGQWGDCKYLSFLNCIKEYMDNNDKHLSQFVNISGTTVPFTVTFKNGSSVKVEGTDIQNSNNADGDIDNVILEIAFRKAIEAEGYSMESSGTNLLGSAKNDWLISKYFYEDINYSTNMFIAFAPDAVVDGVDDFNNLPNLVSTFEILFDEFMNGNISNVVLGSSGSINTIDKRNGITVNNGHAFALKGGVKGKYIEVTNPWNSLDSFKIDWDKIFEYFSGYTLYGDAAKYSIDHNFTNLYYSENGTYEARNINTEGLETFNAGAYGTGLGISLQDITIDNQAVNIFATNNVPIDREISEISENIDAVKELLEEDKIFDLYS